MGHFAEMVICDLQETTDGITSHVEKILFADETYISWQSDKMPEAEYQGRAHQTIYYKQTGQIVEEDNYDAKYMVKKIKYGVIKKREKYEFIPSFHHLDPHSLMHIVLPKLYVPNLQVLQVSKIYSKKKDDRITLTWPFDSNVETQFYFHRVSKKEFDKFKVDGMALDLKIDPEVRKALELATKRVSNKVEDLGTTTAAKFVMEMCNPEK